MQQLADDFSLDVLTDFCFSLLKVGAKTHSLFMQTVAHFTAIAKHRKP